MKRLNALRQRLYEDAQEVLGLETPKPMLRKHVFEQIALRTSIQIEAQRMLRQVIDQATTQGKSSIAAEAEKQMHERASDAVDVLAPAMFEALLVLRYCEGVDMYHLSEEDKEFISLLASHKLACYWLRKPPPVSYSLNISFMKMFLRDTLRSDYIFGRADRKRK